MASLENVYRKFGETAEAAQLLETELGTLLFASNVSIENLFEVKNPTRARELLDAVNRQTLGQILKRLRKTESLEELVAQLGQALDERNRLAHTFFRQHNFRKNSPEGRELMIEDLQQIHRTLLDTYEKVLVLMGVDIEALLNAASRKDFPSPLTGHLPI